MYSDNELHRMSDEAEKRDDRILQAAIVATAIAHEHGLDQGLLEYLLMWMNFHTEHTGKGGTTHEQPHDLTAIDPNAVIAL